VIHAHRGVMPKVDLSTGIAASADVIGDIELGEESSLWFTAVVRGDVNDVRVGPGTNLQDGTVVHVIRNGTPTMLGDYVRSGTPSGATAATSSRTASSASAPSCGTAR